MGPGSGIFYAAMIIHFEFFSFQHRLDDNVSRPAALLGIKRRGPMPKEGIIWNGDVETQRSRV
jgi:hypothetical protein